MGIFQHEGHCVENEYDAIEEDDDKGRYDSVRWHCRCNGETKLQKIRSPSLVRSVTDQVGELTGHFHAFPYPGHGGTFQLQAEKVLFGRRNTKQGVLVILRRS